jgi:glycine betaine/choline ABC-type transport system substrate-binding protein
VLLAGGALPLRVLTLLVFWGLGGIAWVARRSSRAGLYLGGGLILVLSLHGMWVVGQQVTRPRAGSGPVAGQPGQLVIGAKNFVEGEILAEILKQMIETHTELRCEVKKNLTPNIIYKSLKSGDLDLYPEYTGNLLANKEALGLPVPADKSTITRIVREGMREKHSLVLLETFGLNNTYALCVPKPLAKRHGLRTISDLKRVPGLRVVVDLDFLDRDDGWQGLVKTYGLDLPRPKQLSPDLRYRALTSGDADIVCGFATDWEIAFYDLVVLEDDRGYFPNYHGAPLVRADVLQRYPELAKVLNRLAGRIDDDTMRRLNSQVAREKRSEEEVAREFLKKRGLLDRGK